MGSVKRISVSGFVSAGLLLCGTVGALANGPATLTDRQLDRVTAGAIVGGSSDAQAAGVFTLTGTTSNSFLTQDASPYPGQPGLGPIGGVSEGTALSVGTNLGVQGAPPASGTTSVVTGGNADGNLAFNFTVNQTVHGAGGVTFQAGWTFVYGSWVGL